MATYLFPIDLALSWPIEIDVLLVLVIQHGISDDRARRDCRFVYKRVGSVPGDHRYSVNTGVIDTISCTASYLSAGSATTTCTTVVSHNTTSLCIEFVH